MPGSVGPSQSPEHESVEPFRQVVEISAVEPAEARIGVTPYTPG
ncbi:hypothetical protein [Streptomyces subrutilus]|nr:hypothetical protein [Streptomyces subrutilus]